MHTLDATHVRVRTVKNETIVAQKGKSFATTCRARAVHVPCCVVHTPVESVYLLVSFIVESVYLLVTPASTVECYVQRSHFRCACASWQPWGKGGPFDPYQRFYLKEVSILVSLSLSLSLSPPPPPNPPSSIPPSSPPCIALPFNLCRGFVFAGGCVRGACAEWGEQTGRDGYSNKQPELDGLKTGSKITQVPCVCVCASASAHERE